MGGREASRTIQTLPHCRNNSAARYLRIASQQRRLGAPRIGGDHPVVHFRHRTTCVEVERVRWVEWQQDKLLALGQARIFSPEVEWPALLLIQVVEFGYDNGRYVDQGLAGVGFIEGEAGIYPERR